MTQSLRKVALMLATFMVACAAMNHAPAGVATWSGGGGNNSWSTASNWSTVPDTSGTWSLIFGGNTRTTNTNDIGTITFGTMSFTNNGTTGTSAYTLSGSSLAFTNGTIITSATTAGSAITDTIGNALSLTGSNTLNFGAGHNITISGNITGAGSLTKTGDGSLFLTGSNSQSGTTYITGGNIRTGGGGSSTGSNNYAFGTGDVIVSGSGTLTIRNGSTVGNNLTIGGSGWTASNSSLFGSFASSGTTAVVSGSVSLSSSTMISTWGSPGVSGSRLSLAGPINLGSNTLTFSQVITSGTPAVVNAPTTWITVGGTIGGSGSVIVNGTANVYLNGVNTYAGSTTVQSGVLGGNGTIVGDVIVQSGAMLTPGSAANTTGALGVGSLQLNPGAVAAMEITGTSSGLYDQIVGSSSVDYGGGTLALSLSGSYSNDTNFFLFNGFSSHLGQLGSITLSASSPYSGLTFTRDVHGDWWTDWTAGHQQILMFSESTGTLSVVPEPSTIVFAGIGLALMGWQRLAKRRRAARSAADAIAAV